MKTLSFGKIQPIIASKRIGGHHTWTTPSLIDRVIHAIIPQEPLRHNFL